NVNINSATLIGNNITLAANATYFSNVGNPLPNVPAAVLAATVDAEIAVTGNTSITATGFFSAQSTTSVNAMVQANAVPGLPVGEIGVATPVINNTARSRLSNNATVNATGAVTLAATTTSNVTATATGIAALTAMGTTVSIPVIIATTEAF